MKLIDRVYIHHHSDPNDNDHVDEIVESLFSRFVKINLIFLFIAFEFKFLSLIVLDLILVYVINLLDATFEKSRKLVSVACQYVIDGRYYFERIPILPTDQHVVCAITWEWLSQRFIIY